MARNLLSNIIHREVCYVQGVFSLTLTYFDKVLKCYSLQNFLVSGIKGMHMHSPFLDEKAHQILITLLHGSGFSYFKNSYAIQKKHVQNVTKCLVEVLLSILSHKVVKFCYTSTPPSEFSNTWGSTFCMSVTYWSL